MKKSSRTSRRRSDSSTIKQKSASLKDRMMSHSSPSAKKKKKKKSESKSQRTTMKTSSQKSSRSRSIPSSSSSSSRSQVEKKKQSTPSGSRTDTKRSTRSTRSGATDRSSSAVLSRSKTKRMTRRSVSRRPPSHPPPPHPVQVDDERSLESRMGKWEAAKKSKSGSISKQIEHSHFQFILADGTPIHLKPIDKERLAMDIIYDPACVLSQYAIGTLLGKGSYASVYSIGPPHVPVFPLVLKIMYKTSDRDRIIREVYYHRKFQSKFPNHVPHLLRVLECVNESTAGGAGGVAGGEISLVMQRWSTSMDHIMSWQAKMCGFGQVYDMETGDSIDEDTKTTDTSKSRIRFNVLSSTQIVGMYDVCTNLTKTRIVHGDLSPRNFMFKSIGDLHLDRFPAPHLSPIPTYIPHIWQPTIDASDFVKHGKIGVSDFGFAGEMRTGSEKQKKTNTKVQYEYLWDPVVRSWAHDEPLEEKIQLSYKTKVKQVHIEENIQVKQLNHHQLDLALAPRRILRSEHHPKTYIVTLVYDEEDQTFSIVLNGSVDDNLRKLWMRYDLWMRYQRDVDDIRKWNSERDEPFTIFWQDDNDNNDD